MFYLIFKVHVVKMLDEKRRSVTISTAPEKRTKSSDENKKTSDISPEGARTNPPKKSSKGEEHFKHHPDNPTEEKPRRSGKDRPRSEENEREKGRDKGKRPSQDNEPEKCIEKEKEIKSKDKKKRPSVEDKAQIPIPEEKPQEDTPSFEEIESEPEGAVGVKTDPGDREPVKKPKVVSRYGIDDSLDRLEVVGLNRHYFQGLICLVCCMYPIFFVIC